MGGRGGSIGGSHGMQPAAKAAAPAAKAKKAAPKAPAAKMTPAQALVAKLKSDPGALLKMSDSDALTAMKEIAKQTVGSSENNTLVQRYLDAIGWSETKPTILAPGAYGKARRAAGAVNLYHADNDYNGTSGAVFNQNYLSGSKAYSYNGVHGAGTYWASQSAGASASYGTHQIKSFLNSNAKPIRKSQLKVYVRRFTNSHPATARYLSGTKLCGYGGINETLLPIVAASYGYNTILAHNSMSRGSYIVTLNRGATTVCSKTNDHANTSMSDW